MAYATKVLEEELKLKVNKEKTKLTNLHKGVPFLGFVIHESYVGVHHKRKKRFKNKIRKLTKWNSGIPLKLVIKKLNLVLRRWVNYYRAAKIKSFLKDLMQ